MNLRISPSERPADAARKRQVNKVKFCFGIHNHQPVGNFGWVIEEAYQKSYLPFLQLLSRYPDFRISLHFTGVLLEWIKQQHPDMFDLIGSLVHRGQIELLTGGMYEPILPAIPDRDKRGQIEMQTEFIRREFGVTPIGMWLAERVWEPTLPIHLRAAGVQYTILDDIHFRYSGLRADELDGYYLTEDQGAALGLFPIAKRLRYTIPFADPDATVSYLRGLAAGDGHRLGVYADDGEKFGVWPKTHEHCFVDGWLERFLRTITENLDWIEMLTFGEAFAQLPPRGRVYLPTASYSEMNEWAMPADVIEHYDDFVHRLKELHLFDAHEAFIKGGYWRNFQTKYAESNLLHKRMLYVSDLLERSRRSLTLEDYESARRLLFAGQCNCPYWHGVFGGLYLPHLRGAVYQETIAAEALLRRSLGRAKSGVTVEVVDFDCDGADEIIVTGKAQKAFIAPALGGAIVELDQLDIAKNLVDVVGRRKEGYHRKLLTHRESSSESTKSIHDLVLVKEDGLEKLLLEDNYRRAFFVDHLFAPGESLERFVLSHAAELSTLTAQKYDHRHESTSDGLAVTLSAVPTVATPLGEVQIELSKRFRFTDPGGSIVAHYRLHNPSPCTLVADFGVEFGCGSFTWPPNESELRAAGHPVDLSAQLNIANCREVLLHSRLYDFALRWRLKAATEWWTHPLYTVSLSEGGFEKVMQGLILVPRWPLRLEPGEAWETEVTLDFITEFSQRKS